MSINRVSLYHLETLLWIDRLGTFSAAAERLKRVLTNDPMMGVFRHADAGYEDAVACGRKLGVDVPMGQ